MSPTGSWKTAACLVALALVSGLVGALLGRRWARTEFDRRSDPSHWNERAMHDLEQTVKLTPQQRQTIQRQLAAAVEELKGVRKDTLSRSTAIVMRLLDEVDQDLTPEQRPAFQRIRPKPERFSNLNVLNVEREKK